MSAVTASQVIVTSPGTASVKSSPATLAGRSAASSGAVILRLAIYRPPNECVGDMQWMPILYLPSAGTVNSPLKAVYVVASTVADAMAVMVMASTSGAEPIITSKVSGAVFVIALASSDRV